MTTRYTGMNPDGTGNLNDMEHLKQSVRDILTTPLASRVMRREYGSLVPDLIDEPMNNTALPWTPSTLSGRQEAAPG